MTKFVGRRGGCLLNCQQNVAKYSNYFAGESLVFSITFYYLWPKRIMVFSAWTWGSGEEVRREEKPKMQEYFVLTANIAVWDTSKQPPSQIRANRTIRRRRRWLFRIVFHSSIVIFSAGPYLLIHCLFSANFGRFGWKSFLMVFGVKAIRRIKISAPPPSSNSERERLCVCV